MVTGVTWFLPERVLGGVVAGAVTVFGHVVLLAGLAIGVFFQTTFVTYAEADGSMTRVDSFDNDVWVILVVALVLVTGWAWLAHRTGHVGFRVLIVAVCVTVVPIATIVLTVEHPSWWGAAVGVLGAGALGFLHLGRLRESVLRSGR